MPSSAPQSLTAQPAHSARNDGDVNVILFDGDCGFCHRGVRFIIAHDSAKRFRFAPRSSPEASSLLHARGIEVATLPESMVLLDADGVHLLGACMMRIASHLDRPWRLLRCLSIVPPPVLDWGYKVMARNRKRLTRSTAEACTYTPELTARLYRAG